MVLVHASISFDFFWEGSISQYGTGMVRYRVQGLGRRFNVVLEQWTPDQGSLAATLSLEDAWAQQSLD